ncbi:MAG: hypothetical protein F9K24_21205 [Leptonema illini]|jgi:hypothetical protein|uniref:TonB C-terminal domain-containing protein n=1 Tax=Leptonema illini TaxID=183 RepID=A0A833GXL3_9LEPT|nr:MAG: hypothetical protein F9K24_21205 [Leptonema illini]PKL32314.1 MAG: hypothetical protein CVV45_13365 [Spirochaetae bacterium HGW-Spirochaetae-10]
MMALLRNDLLYWIARRTERWYAREWLAAGAVVLALLVVFAQLIFMLLPGKDDGTGEAPEIVAEMNFVEFQEPTETVQSETRDLSDEIIETDKPADEKPVNWANAVDPTMDFDQRFTARLQVESSADDYPASARRSNLGTVTAAVTLYISADGRIRDVRINNLRTSSGNIDAFRDDFVQAVRKIFLTKSRLISSPYKSGGEAKDFTWDTIITFTLQ